MRIALLGAAIWLLPGPASAQTPPPDAQAPATGAQLAALGARVEALEHRLADTEARLSDLARLTQRARRVAQIGAARDALDHGRKLGDLPDAPAALSRFAAEPPPTQDALRIAFTAAARAALDASNPAPSSNSMLARAWRRAQGLVTIRDGDAVIVGAPAAGIISRARAALDGGDLAGCIAALGALDGPARTAISGWVAEAQAVLDARAALDDLAAHI